MSTYAIGDLQGCYQELLSLLDKISFNEKSDRLWFCGDLVNRGPESLECLRFVKSLDAITVLGNHDLHLLAIAAGTSKQRKKDTIDDILNAPDRNELLEWLRQQPLLHHDDSLGYTLVHAGLPPQWNIKAAKFYAKEVENILQNNKADEFFIHMYGDQPDHWAEDLTGWERLRFITNCFTRIRYCDAEGRLNLDEKGPPGSQSENLIPWFKVTDRASQNDKIVFGHWATVCIGEENNISKANVFPLDTGCVWGRELTAMCLEDGKYFSVPSKQKESFDD